MNTLNDLGLWRIPCHDEGTLPEPSYKREDNIEVGLECMY